MRLALALLVTLILGACSASETSHDDASSDAASTDAPSSDAPSSDAPFTDTDVGIVHRALSLVGGFGSGASVHGARYHLVAQGFDWSAPMCTGTRCVVGGFSR